MNNINNINNNRQEKMNPRQWRLYRLIEERTANGEKTMVADICNAYPEDYHLSARPSNFTNCPAIYKDIDFINSSPEVDKIIIKNNNDFKLASEEEAEKYANNVLDRALRLFKKYHNVCFKMKIDGQCKVINNQGNQVDFDGEPNFHESFINYIN